MLRDPHDAQVERPSGTADRFPQAFPQPARTPLRPAGGEGHGQGMPAPRLLPDGLTGLDRVCLRDGEDVVLVPLRLILMAEATIG